MAQYEAVLVKYPELEPPDNRWWTADCPARAGCVSNGLTREEAQAMIADAMASHLEEATDWHGEVFDAARTRAEKAKIIAECHTDGRITELHWVQPRFMTEEEMSNNPRFADLYGPAV